MKATKKAMSPRRRQARYFCKVLDWIYTNMCVIYIHCTYTHITTQRAPVGFNVGFKTCVF